MCVCILLESGHRSPCPRRCHHVPLQKGMSKGHAKRTGGPIPPYSHGFRQHALSFFWRQQRRVSGLNSSHEPQSVWLNEQAACFEAAPVGPVVR